VDPVNPLSEPLETQWQTVRGAEYARIYQNKAAVTNQNAVTTWDKGGPITGGGQTVPGYAGIESIRVSANWVYVKGSSLPHYTMGPWYFDAAQTQVSVNLPSQWGMLARFPLRPQPAVEKKNTNFGPTAIWLNAAIEHNQLDAFYWDGTADVDTNAKRAEYWTRNARLAEGLTFDTAGAHQPFTGEVITTLAHSLCVTRWVTIWIMIWSSTHTARLAAHPTTVPSSAGVSMAILSMAPMATARRMIRRAQSAAWSADLWNVMEISAPRILAQSAAPRFLSDPAMILE
jgi:hypothetical protein